MGRKTCSSCSWVKNFVPGHVCCSGVCPAYSCLEPVAGPGPFQTNLSEITSYSLTTAWIFFIFLFFKKILSYAHNPLWPWLLAAATILWSQRGYKRSQWDTDFSQLRFLGIWFYISGLYQAKRQLNRTRTSMAQQLRLKWEFTADLGGVSSDLY